MNNWTTLKSLQAETSDRSILSLFDAQDRASNFSVRAEGMLFDYAKTNIDETTRDALVSLLDDVNFSQKRDAMFSGTAINETEGRSVLHTALRNLDGEPVLVDGVDVMPSVLETLERMRRFAKNVRASEITDIVNIGIGGSDLGPAMAVQALAPFHDGPRCHFVSNVDGAHIADTLRGLDAKTTMVIVASKTFTTIETMTNAQTARAWMIDGGGDPSSQFAALSSATQKTSDFGIDDARVFGFADWVGGRYSVWGPIGLSLMIAIGPDAFDDFLRGAQNMDLHFRSAPALQNMPIMLALVGIWHAQVCGYPTRAVLPYDERLGQLPDYLQQLEMESNGKSVAMDGSNVQVPTGPIVWGAAGTNGQHAFYQLIHQGTHIIPCEFLVAANGHEPNLRHHHQLLVANCLAQSEALMLGRGFEKALSLKAVQDSPKDDQERQASHRVFSGNRPSTTLIYPKLTPFALGQIIALYEHRVFVEGVVLGINSFDQWGVELGKELAKSLQPMIEGGEVSADKDSSTKQLLDYVKHTSD